MLSTTSLQIHTLPPTLAAASYHSKRIMSKYGCEWDGGEHLIPQEWRCYVDWDGLFATAEDVFVTCTRETSQNP